MVEEELPQDLGFRDSKKRYFKKVLKEDNKKKHKEIRLPSPKTKVIKGKVREVIAVSSLEKKFEEHKILSLKIPKPKSSLSIKIPQAPNKELVEKEKRLKQKQIRKKLTLLIISSEEYLKSIVQILKYANTTYSKILYISLNELYDNLIRNLENNGIDTKNFYFIDAITRTAQTNIEEKDNCIFVTSPNALIELSLAISKKIDEMEPDLIIFDSLSTLFIYENEATSVKFVHSLIGKMKAAGCDSILTSLEGDAKREAIKDLGMFVDEFLTMSEYNLRQFKSSDKVSVIPKSSPKEEELKEEMDKIFPQRKEQAPFLEHEKKPILSEMGKIKNHLSELKKGTGAKSEMERLEKKIKVAEKKPKDFDVSKIHEKLVSIRKKTVQLKNGEGKGPGEKNPEKPIGKIKKELFGIEKKLDGKKEKSKKPKKKEKIKKAIKKKSESQVKKLEKKLALLQKNFEKKKIGKIVFEKEKKKLEKLLKK